MHAVPTRLSRSASSAALPLWRTRSGSYARVACCHWRTRALSTDAPAAKGDTSASAGADEKPQEILIYQGGRAKPLRILKTASFINCTASLIGSPVIVTADIAMPFAARLGMATTMAFFGLSTTGFLAWVSKPYLLRMALRKTESGCHELLMDSVKITGRVRTTVVPLQPLEASSAGATGVASADVVLPQLPGVTLDKGPSVFVNPFSTFKYKDKWHFVDHVGEVHRPDLMAQLLGTETWPPPDSDDAE